MADTRNATTVGRTVGGDRLHRSAALIATGVATSSAAALAFEIALTRVFAAAQFYHFAFLSVSLALLGFGASGSALTAFPALGSGGPRRWGRLAAAQSIATVAAYLVINTIPFDSFAIAWDRRQILYLLVYYLVLAVPFFFAGLIVAVLLMGGDAQSPVPSHRIYAASLVGSAAGAVIALVGIDWLGGAGAIFAAAALAMAAAAAFGHADSTHRWDWWAPAIAAAGLVLVALWVPPPVHMRLSPYKDLSGALRYPGAEIVETRWDGGTRIDLVQSDGIRSLPGVSLTFSGVPPPQDGLTFDGDELSPVPRVEPVEADFAGHLLGSLAYLLRPGADALVLEPRGGFDVLVALALDADSVVAVEPHADAVHLTGVGGPSPYDDDRVRLAFTTPRTYLERTEERFDVIDLALTSPYRPVASGAYSLAEDYRLTIEAFEQALGRLAPDGIVTVMRWVQLPASEETRLLATAVEALRRRGADPSDALVMLRSYATAVLLVQPDGFSPAELDQVAAFAEEERFDIVTAPNLDSATTNRYNVVPDEPYSRLASDLLAAPDPVPIYRSHAFEIAPATDDHPFFGHYFKWSQATAVRESLGRTWQPFGGAGYFVLLALLAISTVAALVLIAAPLLFRSHTKTPTPQRVRWWTVAYFGLLGIAFLFIEIPLIQRYILLVGQPAEAFAVVVFAILVASGVGSAWSRRIAWRPAAIVLALAAAGYPVLVAWITPILLPAPALLRMVAAALLVAPLGFLMGVMFPRGLAYLETAAPQLVPWAWGINGTVSVISAAAAAVLALSFGFSFVVWMGALAYGGAAVLARSSARVA
jgi:hypothetical protein